MPVSAASLCSLAASIPSRGPALPASVSALAASLQPKPLGGSLRGRFVSLEGWADGDELARARGVWAVTCGSAVSGAAACPPFDAEALCWRFLPLRWPPADAAAQLARAAAAPDARAFTVRLRDSDAVLGAIFILANRPAALAAELGMIVYTPAAQGTAVNAEAALLLLARLFDAGYRRVEWKCNARNERSIAAARRLGFAPEGVFRSHLVVPGVGEEDHSRDTAWFAILAEDWPATREKLHGWVASDEAAARTRQRLSVGAER